MNKTIPKQKLESLIKQGIDDCWETASTIMDYEYYNILIILKNTFNEPVNDMTAYDTVVWFLNVEREFKLNASLEGYDNINPRVYSVPIIMNLFTIPEIKEEWYKLLTKGQI